ncbi:LTA synthase family protein [Halorussus limi]|uniref:LTA synthase family protein n=1 Tax=Halorussus limi TaxID=2938695 RepID=A0A8U0HPS2_9EURY|nr:LTA synthase family protein [Halorussus limi]UPV72861.1 LTA synthase family protein [Halorussus limi]
MSLQEWIGESSERIRRNGWDGVKMSAREFYVEGRRRVVRRTLRSVPGPDGTNVFEKDWDVLVLLDCARPDLFADISGDYDFLDDSNTLTSVGSSSSEWIANTFVDEYEEEMAETIYVTANSHSPEIKNQDWLKDIKEVWRYGWDGRERTVLPRTVTDRAISVGRNREFDRLIVHYMQPHAPFVGYDDTIAGGGMTPPDVERDGVTFGKALRMGHISRREAWEAHVQNLEYVLEDVALLRENIAADTFVVSADHGQALGERFVYSHPDGMPLNVLREVPWIVTDATDTGSHDPDVSTTEPRASEDVDEKLRALGYRT